MKNVMLILCPLLCLWFKPPPLLAQIPSAFLIKVEPLFNNQALVLNKTLNSDSLSVTVCRFYLSNFQFFNQNQSVWIEKNSYHLVDAAVPNSLNLAFDLPQNLLFDSLSCHLGIDSLTNTEGAKGGDLDATKGMYWAWQSGYINFKLEGTSRLCPTRKNQFQFHLGGFIGADNALQTIGFHLNNGETNNSKLIIHNARLSFDIAKFLAQTDLKITNHIMSPSAKAVDLAAKVAAVFSVLPFR